MPSVANPVLSFDEQFHKELDPREEACIAAIKAIHAGPPLFTSKDVAFWRKRVSGIGVTCNAGIPKRSPSGRLIGWYRLDQKRGKPNRLSPLEQAVQAAIDEFNALNRSAVPQVLRAARLGRQSGAKRAKSGLKPQIAALLQALTEQNVPRARQAKLIAKEFHCSIEYVQRVRRNLAKAGAVPLNPGKTLPEQETNSLILSCAT